MDLKNRVHSHVLAPGTKSTAPKHGSVGFFDIPTGLRSAFFGFLQYMDFGAPGAPRELKHRAPGVPGLSKDGILQKVKKVLWGGSGTQKVLENTAYLQHGFEKSSSLSCSGAGHQIHGAKTWKCWHFSEVGCSRG